MHYQLLFPKKYLRAIDIIEAKRKTGKDSVVLTISKVEPRHELKTQKGTEFKPILHFEEFEKFESEGKGINKKYVGNITNFHIIGSMYGGEVEAWVGKKIAFSTVRDVSFGKLQDRIVILNTAPGGDA